MSGSDKVKTEEIDCPFCGEDDFDFIGLKHHLASGCSEFDAVPVLSRFNCTTAPEASGSEEK